VLGVSTENTIVGSGNKGLIALLVAQFMGAANDNILKTLLGFFVVRGMWEGKLGQGGQGIIALCLFVPFIFFSGWAGPLADRFSKRSIAIQMKFLELPLAVTAGCGFIFDNFWLTAVAMILLATQSTFFSPAKYGMIPELVPKPFLSRANGFLNMTTNIAVITGMLVAGFVSTSMQEVAGVTEAIEIEMAASTASITLLPGFVLSVVAIVGIVAIVWLPKLKPLDPTTTIPINPFSSYISTIKNIFGTPLFTCAIAWAMFYLLATVALLVVTELGVVLQVDDTQVSYLLASIGIAVGLGSLAAGFLSKGSIRLEFSKRGAIAMIIVLGIAGLAPVSYWTMLVCLVGLGIAAGFYAIPLQSLMQLLPVPARRGRVLATSNALSFLFMAIGSLTYWGCRPLFGSDPQHIFVACSLIAVIAWRICRCIPSDCVDSN
jgi:acyl-[acyl-carrier-protein]-phospholipid O-acyltransferase/long-chain-fatty-acid--[acyl-carrier-protein] ligase